MPGKVWKGVGGQIYFLANEVDEGINIDFDDGGRLIGLEILDATERYALSDIFNISTENLFPEGERHRQAPAVVSNQGT